MPPIVDRPEVEALACRLYQIRAAVLEARPAGAVLTGDVAPKLMEVVRAELADVVPDLDREDLALLRWVCGYEEPVSVARLVCMLQRAHAAGASGAVPKLEKL